LGIESSAAHIVGGELYYDYLANNQYLITMVVYRDCQSTTQFDQSASLGVFRTSNGSFYDSFDMSLDNAIVSEMPPVLENPCNLLPEQICIEQAIYTITVTLPPIAGGYTLAYQRCCRPNGIDNLLFNQQGSTLTTTIPGTALLPGQQNSSARFTELPPLSMCLGSAFYFDHGATDPDGDQLVYSFCNPLNGATADAPMPNPPAGPPYSSITWANGFSATNPITSSPQFTIDSQTGYITGTPTQLGVYVISVCVSEFRNGVLINTVSRDFQYQVNFCESSQADFPSMENSSYETCSGLVVSFENTSTASSNTFYHWDFGIQGTNADTSNLAEPTFTFPGPGTYFITLTTNPGWPCEDDVMHEYIVYPAVEPTISVVEYECVGIEDAYDFIVSGTFSNMANISWNFGSGSDPLTSADATPVNIIFPSSAPSWNVSVQVEENGCVGNDTETIINPSDPVVSINPQTTFCNGLTYNFSADASNAIALEWDFGGLGTENTIDILNPAFNYSSAGEYEVMLVASAPNTCNDTAFTSVYVAPIPQPYFETGDPQCLSSNSFSFDAEGANSFDPSYSWNFGPFANVATSSEEQPQGISFTAVGNHVITLTLTENGCSSSYEDSVTVAQNILPDFTIQNSTGCPGLIAEFVANTSSEVPVNYTWDFGNGSISTQANTSHTYDLPGTYSVTITAFTNEGCYDSLTITFPDAVVIYPSPDPGFSISPQVVEITDSETQIESFTEDGTCVYYMSDGGQSDRCDFQYSWTEAGTHTITQVVTSPQGCTATATGEVMVQGHTFYAPTSFSPNDDGINDYWRPISTGISSFFIRIYNRWGELVYSSSDMDRPWMGQVSEGDYYAPNGIYYYRVLIEDLLFQKHEYQGSFTVIR
jgi:gliding motility-associated-like protein